MLLRLEMIIAPGMAERVAADADRMVLLPLAVGWRYVRPASRRRGGFVSTFHGRYD